MVAINFISVQIPETIVHNSDPNVYLDGSLGAFVFHWAELKKKQRKR